MAILFNIEPPIILVTFGCSIEFSGHRYKWKKESFSQEPNLRNNQTFVCIIWIFLLKISGFNKENLNLKEFAELSQVISVLNSLCIAPFLLLRVSNQSCIEERTWYWVTQVLGRIFFLFNISLEKILFLNCDKECRTVCLQKSVAPDISNKIGK